MRSGACCCSGRRSSASAGSPTSSGTWALPKAVLTDRLATLVEQGILKRVPYQAEGERQRHEYRLTTKGIDLYPTLVALMAWGDKYLSEDLAPLELRHRECEEAVHLALVCDAGHELSGAHDVRPVPRTSAVPAAGR